MLFPIPDADQKHPTLPWATYALLALLVLTFLPNYFADHAGNRQGTRLLERALEYHAEHPYLKLDPRLEQVLAAQGGIVAGSPAGTVTGTARGGKKSEFAALEQAELDGLARAGFDALERLSYWRWGLVAGDVSFAGLFGHLFLHAGWIPLLGNLLLLCLAGGYLEGRWGWWAVPACYLASGTTAAVAFIVTHSNFPMPLLGASAGVAGLVAACAVTFGFKKVLLRYWFGRGWGGTVEFPALLLLVCWGLREALSLVDSDVLTPAGLARAVVYPHHVAGFCAGVVFGSALRSPAARRRAVLLTRAAARTLWSRIPLREPRARTVPEIRLVDPLHIPQPRPTVRNAPLPEAQPVGKPAQQAPRGPETLPAAAGSAGGHQVVPGALLGVKDGKLSVELADGTQRTVPLSQVRGIAAAGLYDGGLKPAYVLDLALGFPLRRKAAAKVLRCHSDGFDPRRLVPNEPDLESALLSLAVRLLRRSGAVWLVGGAPSRLKSFGTLEEYEQELLVALRKHAASA